MVNLPQGRPHQDAKHLTTKPDRAKVLMAILGGARGRVPEASKGFDYIGKDRVPEARKGLDT